MNSIHVIHEITSKSKYRDRKCPIRLQPFVAGDRVIVCQRTGSVFTLEGFYAFSSDWHGRCPYCKEPIDIQNIPEDDDPQTELPQERSDNTEVDFIDTGPIGLIWAINGKRRGSFYKTRNGTTIGRKYGDILLDDPKISKRHAKFTLEDDRYVLWDLGSTNGTFVNGQRIRGATILKENDEIRMGDTLYVYKILA
jgi:hypothetical protein